MNNALVQNRQTANIKILPSQESLQDFLTRTAMEFKAFKDATPRSSLPH